MESAVHAIQTTKKKQAQGACSGGNFMIFHEIDRLCHLFLHPIWMSQKSQNTHMLTLGQKPPFERNAQAAAKPTIYRMGQAPSWAEDEEEGMALPVGKKTSASSRTNSSSGGRTIAAPTIVSASSSAAIAAVSATSSGAARPKFTAEVVRSASGRRVAEDDDMDQSDDERPRRSAHSTDAPIVTVDEEEDADRRARVKAKLARQRAEEQAALEAASRQQEDEDMQSEGEEDEFEEETDESDDEYQTEDSSRVLLKPIFVSKSDRETVDDKTLAEHADEEVCCFSLNINSNGSLITGFCVIR
jgi:hypothetical protein